MLLRVSLGSITLSADIGTLVFNYGESCAVKVMIQRKEDETTVHLETQEPFRDYRDLKRDLEFYHRTISNMY